MLGFLCQWVSYKVKLPAILLLLLCGLVLGPLFSVIDPNALFGDLLFPFISLSVAVILFEGALTLKRNELNEIATPVRRMVTIGVLVNGLIMTVATHYLANLSWSLSALFGAIMVVTGPTVIMPMLKTVRPTPKIGNVLRWEGIVIDPIGALIAVLVFEWIVVQHTSSDISEIFKVFSITVLVGTVVGLVAGYILGVILRNHFVPERMQNFAALALVCATFAVSDSLMHESGLLAVTLMGVLVTNMKGVHIEAILEFKEDLTMVFVSSLFIVLAARLDFAAFLALGSGVILLLLVMQFIARPAKVALSFIGSNFTWREQAMIAWIGPRGIVAAAVSAVFALRLEELGMDGADKLVPLAFLIIIGTVVLQSLTARPMAKLLKVALPSTQGALIVGANRLSISLAEALSKEDIDTLICDTNWDNLREARNAGLTTYYGNPSSDHADLHLDLSLYGSVLALSSHFEFNATQATSFRDEFGARNVYMLPPNQSSERLHKHSVSEKKSGRLLFGEEHSFRKVNRQLMAGAQVKVTELSNEFTSTDWGAANPDAIALAWLKPSGELKFNTTDNQSNIDDNAKLFYLSEREQPQSVTTKEQKPDPV